jgi:methylthioribose-1-phosphate isomerase
VLDVGFQAVLAEALDVLAENEAANLAAARGAADMVEELCGEGSLNPLTHCNTGWLATVAVGTALGAITELARRGRIGSVLVDETRPLLQGSRLTAWELRQVGIPHRICVDSAAAHAMRQGAVDCVLVGADRVSTQGDVANKIGTYGLAVLAAHHGIPFVVVATEMTIDERARSDADFVIEERAADEVYPLRGPEESGARSEVFNPAFDVTPWELVSALVTEKRRIRNAAPYRSDPFLH